ncbi:M48 family metalloprotease [Patescibacteria group bacterium]|nr:M48 family metalloprotease [Patescibacteria group bacterium]
MYNQITSNKRKTWLLLILFFGVILALGYAFGYYYGDVVGLLSLAGLIAIIMTLVGYYGGDKVALGLAGAKITTKQDNPYLWRLVENLCLSQGLPMPKVYVMPEGAINAFAAGRDPKHASLAVTQGALTKLTNEELEGVLAHELSHIKNFDIRLATLVIVLVGLIAIMSDILLRSHLFGSRRSSNNNRQGGGLIMILGLILAVLSPLIAQLIKLAISRKREFLADASAALMTRYPEGLANALNKIANDTTPLTKVSPATQHLYLAAPFTGKKFMKLLATHPPIEARIKALKQMT